MVWLPASKESWSPKASAEGGVLRNRDGKRFMFDDIPANYKAQTATPKKKAGDTRRAINRPAVLPNC